MMNKYQIAVRFFKRSLTPIYLNSFTKGFCKRYDDKLNDLRELVDRATPQKPLLEGDGYVDGELVYDIAFCPNCNAEFEYGYGNWGDPYCPKCGQALDWVDDEDA